MYLNHIHLKHLIFGQFSFRFFSFDQLLKAHMYESSALYTNLSIILYTFVIPYVSKHGSATKINIRTKRIE